MTETLASGITCVRGGSSYCWLQLSHLVVVVVTATVLRVLL